MRVRFYGFLRDYVGGRDFEVSLRRLGRDGVRVEGLPEILAKAVPGFSKVLKMLKSGEIDIIFLVNDRPAGEGEVVSDEDTVDVLPPASGG